MIREHTIQCDECLQIAPLKDHDFYTIHDDDFCRMCIDSVLARLLTIINNRGDK
jgi:hypothetical protein